MATFFIGGCMRSGTALLQSVLCSDSTTNPLIAEAQYFTRLINLYIYGKRSFDNFLKDPFAGLSEFTRFSQDGAQNFLQAAREHLFPCLHLVLKNPEMTPVFAEVHELVDDALFLVTIRDPRDTIVSILEVAKKQAKAGLITNLTKIGRDMERLSQFYNSYYWAVINPLSESLKANMLFLRYEDLIGKTEATLAKIRSFTGLDLVGYDPGVPWQRSTRDYESLKTHPLFGPWMTDLTGGPMSRQAIGRYRERLSRAEAAEIERQCADIFRMFGYRPGSG